uniref:Secreted protein n=1 Tax=Rhipicephalus appendiculatus TaxID=34631 RepID=A0A131YDG0_RHIAP
MLFLFGLPSLLSLLYPFSCCLFPLDSSLFGLSSVFSSGSHAPCACVLCFLLQRQAFSKNVSVPVYVVLYSLVLSSTFGPLEL